MSQFACRCSMLDNIITVADIQEILEFLLDEVGFKTELSTEYLFSSLSTEFVAQASSTNPQEVPLNAANNLFKVIAMCTRSDKDAREILSLAARQSPTQFFKSLKARNQSHLFGILSLHNRFYYYQRDYSAIAESNSAGRIDSPKWADLGDAMSFTRSSSCVSAFRRREPLEVYKTHWNSVLREQRDWKIPNNTKLSAWLVPLKFGVETAISTFGHSRLSSTQEGMRFCKVIRIAHNIPIVTAKLVLCHELVHVALWLKKPKRSFGYSVYEEILCHAVVIQYIDALTAHMATLAPNELYYSLTANAPALEISGRFIWEARGTGQKLVGHLGKTMCCTILKKLRADCVRAATRSNSILFERISAFVRERNRVKQAISLLDSFLEGQALAARKTNNFANRGQPLKRLQIHDEDKKLAVKSSTACSCFS